MVLSISIDQSQFRLDSERPPYATLGGLVAPSFIKIADWSYKPVDHSLVLLEPPNRSRAVLPVSVRNLDDTVAGSWGNDADISEIDNSPAGTGKSFLRTANEGFDGAWNPVELDGQTVVSIQAKITSIYLSTGISFQSNIVSHNYLDTSIEHAMLLGYAGQGQIRELGQVPIVNGYFQYEVGDTAMIELTGGYAAGVIRYFLIKADGTMQLIRTTRSRLTNHPIAELLLYFTNSRLNNVLYCNDQEATTNFETIAILENFQDWFNDFFVASTADVIQMADNNPQFTFPNHKQRLRTLTANLNMRQKADRDDFLAFFNYHGIEIPFIFIDNAHKDPNGNPTEFWARFSSAFGDKARQSCLSAHAATIIEDYRNDYIPKLLDPDPPTVPKIDDLSAGGAGEIWMTIGAATNNIVNYQYHMKHLVGRTYGSPVDVGLNLNPLIEGLVTGDDYYFQVRAVDYSGRISAWSTEDFQAAG